MPGPAPKRPENRSRPPRRSLLTVLEPTKPRTAKPKAPDGLSAAVRGSWDTFWASPLAEHTIATDVAALERLFRFYEQRERYLDLASEDTLSLGSTGQIVLHPLIKEVDALDAKILALEDRFGLSPMSRLKLQVTLGDASKSLAEVNAALAAKQRPEEADPDDPRRIGVQ
jgi:P27 family predicted phage terminase small subunit